MRPHIKIFVLLAGLTSALLAFQNCAESLPDVSVEPSIAPTPQAIPEALTFAYAPQTLAEDIVVNLGANHGVPPYIFGLESRIGGSIAGNIVRTPRVKGAIVVKVTDAAGATLRTTLDIPADPLTGSYAASCMNCHNDTVNSVADCDCFRIDPTTSLHTAINYGQCNRSAVKNIDGTLTCE